MATIRIKRGGGTPSGLTFGEPAYDTTNSKLFVGLTSGSVWVGAEVDNGDLTTNSQIKIPTQYAVKQYVDGFVGGGAVTTLNGLTGAVFIDAGTGISVAAAGKGITLTNVGVTSITGTPNQITASASTGDVTISLPSAITAPGSLTVTTDLTVSGNLTVNGTTTTVNSDVATIDDPMIMLGTSGGVPIAASDGGKDRGVAFTYFSGSGATGFFGYDASATKFTFVPSATIVGDIVTAGNPGDAQFKSLFLTTDGTNIGGLTLATLSASRTYTLPNVSGTIVTTGDTGTVTSTMILDGTIINDDINASAGIVDTKLAQIASVNKVALTALDIDGGTDIGSALTDADLIIVDDGGAGTNRKAAVTRISDYVFGKVSGDITIASNGAATIAANSVALGTDTTGNYAADVSVSGIGLTISGSAGEGTSYVITSGATSANSVSQIVARDSSGNFSAGTITATLSGNASTATTLQTARTIGITGDIDGTATSFDGSANITISATIAPNSVALGTDTTGNYVATVATTSAGLVITNSGTENAAVGVNLQKVNSGIDFGTFAFTTNEFTNNGSGTVAIGVVDGGSY